MLADWQGARAAKLHQLAAVTSTRVASVLRASLDVFRKEPLPEGHPFWQRQEITITPHISARTLRDATLEQITGKIRDHAAGRAISGIVDTDRGY